MWHYPQLRESQQSRRALKRRGCGLSRLLPSWFRPGWLAPSSGVLSGAAWPPRFSATTTVTCYSKFYMAIYKPPPGPVPRRKAAPVILTVGSQRQPVFRSQTINRAKRGTSTVGVAQTENQYFQELDQIILWLDAAYSLLPQV